MDEDFKRSYRTREWERLRKAVLERDRHRCQICGKTAFYAGRLQVHHITYEYCGGVAYGAPMADLITLCENCHKHDDGDHRYFFNRRILIVPGLLGGSLPFVLHTNQWNWFDGMILSAEFASGIPSRRVIGFHTHNEGVSAYFPFVLGFKGENDVWICDYWDSTTFTDIRPAYYDERERFIKAVEKELSWILKTDVSSAKWCSVLMEGWLTSKH